MLVNLLTVGCLADTPARVTGEHGQFIISDMQLAQTASRAFRDAIDLDGDDLRDNALGATFATLRTYGFDIQPTLTAAIQNGDILLGLDVQTTSFEDAAIVGVQIRTGFDAAPSPCSADMPMVCGQHLHGGATLVADSAAPLMYSTGALAKGTLMTRGGILPVRLALDVDNFIELNLHDAAISINFQDTNPTGILAGVVPAADVARVIIPQTGLQFRRIIDQDCGSKAPGLHRKPPYCQCRSKSRGSFLIELFDRNEDCIVDDQELLENSIIHTLLASDIEGVDGPGVSFALAIKLVPATFALVAP